MPSTPKSDPSASYAGGTGPRTWDYPPRHEPHTESEKRKKRKASRRAASSSNAGLLQFRCSIMRHTNCACNPPQEQKTGGSSAGQRVHTYNSHAAAPAASRSSKDPASSDTLTGVGGRFWDDEPKTNNDFLSLSDEELFDDRK